MSISEKVPIIALYTAINPCLSKRYRKLILIWAFRKSLFQVDLKRSIFNVDLKEKTLKKFSNIFFHLKIGYFKKSDLLSPLWADLLAANIEYVVVKMYAKKLHLLEQK
jgi:hypothetical protein